MAVELLPLVGDFDVIFQRLPLVEALRTLWTIESDAPVDAFDVRAKIRGTRERLVALRAVVFQFSV